MRLIVLIALFFSFNLSFAKHIVGGGFDAQWLGGNNFSITLKLLRDCRSEGGANFDRPKIRIGIYRKKNDNLVLYYELDYISKKNLDFVKPKCGGVTIECTEEGVYNKVVWLDPNLYNDEEGYYISWERCCRNNIISNIDRPEDASMVFYAEIPKVALNNSTPRYTNNPVTLLCLGNAFTYNFDFIDADGDKLVYSLVNPLNGNLTGNTPNGNPNAPINLSGPYKDVVWSTPFSANNAISGNPSLKIDAATGEITVTPTQVGTYVAAIKVEEYRNGVKIGEVRLELQFNAIVCAPNPVPVVIATDSVNPIISQTYFDVSIPNSICIDLKVTDSDSLFMTVKSSIFSSSFKNKPKISLVKNGYKTIDNELCWQTDCEHGSLSEVRFNIEVKDDGCPVPQVIKKEIIIRVSPMKRVPPPVFKCLGLLQNGVQLNWVDTNNTNMYGLLKSYKIYRGVNDTGYKLISQLGKLANQYLDNAAINNRIVNYTYKIISVNQCDSDGIASPFVGTINSIPKVIKSDTLNITIESDTIDFEIYKTKCIYLKSKDAGDSLRMRISSSLFSEKKIGNLPFVDTLIYAKNTIENKFCFTPGCEAYNLGITPVDIELTNLSCPIENVGTRRIWINFLAMPPVESTNLLCMTLANNETYVYYGDTSVIERFNYFLVYRGIDFKDYRVIDTIWRKGPRYFLDKNTPNNKTINYCYFMIGVNKCNLKGNSSDTLSTFEQVEYIPKRQNLFTVTVDTTKNIRIAWRPSAENDFAKYFLFKSIDNGATYTQISTLENVMDTFFVDKEVDVNKQRYCYYLNMHDTCENTSPNGKVSCSILLKGKSAKLTHQLEWSPYDGWVNGVDNYEIKRQPISQGYKSLVFVNNNKFNDEQLDYDEGAYNYYVVAKEDKGDGTVPDMLAESKSNEVFLFQNPNVFAPNAFTRNGDGLNDVFNVAHSFVLDFNLKIYNRWGQLVFETNDKKKSWDGSHFDSQVQSDVYFYVINYSGFDRQSYSKTGNLSLIR